MNCHPRVRWHRGHSCINSAGPSAANTPGSVVKICRRATRSADLSFPCPLTSFATSSWAPRQCSLGGIAPSCVHHDWENSCSYPFGKELTFDPHTGFIRHPALLLASTTFCSSLFVVNQLLNLCTDHKLVYSSCVALHSPHPSFLHALTLATFLSSERFSSGPGKGDEKIQG